MIFKSLDFLPYKLFFEIADTGDVTRLANSEKEPEDFTDEEVLAFSNLWENLLKRFQELDSSGEAGKTLKIEREVEYFRAKYKLVLIYCEILGFDWDEETAAAIRDFGYTLRDDENYYPDLTLIRLEAEALLVKAEVFEAKLPKTDPEKQNEESSIDKMLASYSAILGIDFDYNTVSVTKVLGLKNQVDLKIKISMSQKPK